MVRAREVPRGGGGELRYPDDDVPAVQRGRREAMLGRQAVLDIDHGTAMLLDPEAGVGLLAVHVADAEAAAVEDDDERGAARRGHLGHICADRNRIAVTGGYGEARDGHVVGGDEEGGVEGGFASGEAGAPCWDGEGGDVGGSGESFHELWRVRFSTEQRDKRD